MTKTKIEELNLSVRAFNVFKRNGFDTVEQVLDKTPHQLCNYRGIGEKIVEEFCCKARNEGYLLPYTYIEEGNES